MRKLILSLSLLSALSLSSCAEDAVAPPTEDPMIRAGSTFTFEHRTYSDTLWTGLSSTDTLTSTVSSIDTAYAGQLHAHFVASLTDTTIYRLLPDSNLSLYQPTLEIQMTGVRYPEFWSVLPIATKESSITILEEDSATTIQTQSGPRPAIVHTSVKTGYVGAGSVTVNGKSYATEETFIEYYIGVGVQGLVSFTRVRIIYAYSTELKAFVARKQKIFSNHDFAPFPNGGETWTLVRFTL